MAKYTAISKTGKSVTKNDKREFNFGHFSHTLHDCDECIQHRCEEGVTQFEGFSKKRVRRSWKGCSRMRVEMEIVKLIKE